MFCRKCGSEIEENEKFCSNCGMPIMNRTSQQFQGSMPVQKKKIVNQWWFWVGIVSIIAIVMWGAYKGITWYVSSKESVYTGSVRETNKVKSLSITVQNDTGVDIYGLYASTADKDNWEEDILGTDILFDGESYIIRFTYLENQTIWDFAIKDRDDNMIEFYGLDFSKCNSDSATLILEYDGEQGYASLQ